MINNSLVDFGRHCHLLVPNGLLEHVLHGLPLVATQVSFVSASLKQVRAISLGSPDVVEQLNVNQGQIIHLLLQSPTYLYALLVVPLQVV